MKRLRLPEVGGLAGREWQGLELWLSSQYFRLDVRPKLGTQITGQVKPEPQRALQESQTYSIEPIGIPLIRKKGRTVRAPEAPYGKGLAACVRARQYGAADSMSRATPEPRAMGSKISRVLVQRGVQAKGQNTVNTGAGQR